ncbi:PAS domain S-box protein [Halorubrum sp. RMP-47]|uniref:PAS domain S-box protein n=1 Tax=Halorubrum miltondacostae TaxID=3076378 RepID=UPI0035270E54
MASGSLESIHVLHVDDEPDFADVAADFIKREDNRFDVEVATDPNEAFDSLNGGQFDCIVSDYDMPKQNGIEFLETIRENYPDIPFILFTGKGSEEVASDAISAGVTDYLQKGSGTSQYTVLANRIRNAVTRYDAQAELADREKRLNLFFEQSPLGVVEWDDQFNLARINEAGEDILGYTQDDLRGHSWEKIVPESDRDAVGDVVTNLLEDKGGYYSINENIRKDGERIICEWHNRVVTDEDGSVVAIFSQFQDITERKKQVRENDRRRHRLEQILKTVPGCVVQLDANGEFMLANDRAEEVLGLDSDAVTDRAYNDPEWKIRDLNGDPIPDEELPFRRVRDTGKPVYGAKHAIEWPDGTQKELLVNGAPLFDDDGNVDSVVCSLTDITEQRNRERELQKTQRRLKLALETTETGVYEWDIETDDVVWDDSLEQVMGIEPGEFEGTFQAFADRVHPEDLPQVEEQIDHAVETESMYRTEFRMKKADGDYQWVEARGRIIQDEGNDRMIGVHRDITEQKVQERALDRQRSLLKAQQEAMIDGLVVVNEHGNMVSYNDRLLDLWGIPQELAESQDESPVLDWVTDQLNSPEKFLNKVEHLYENPEETSRDEINLADGRVFDRYTAPVIGESGVHYGRLWMFRDITQQKERETELERQNDRLEEFASVVSHDLRNPLNVAQGRLELSMEECDSKHLSRVEDALERSQTLIDDLLTLARDGREVSNIEAVNLEILADSCWHNVATGEATVRVETDRTIRADRSRLQRLLGNLYRNAVDHGGNDVAVTVGDLADGFYIEDDGPGIPADEQDDVLKSGYSTTEEGTGFGLNIVQRIVESHGWEMRIAESSTGGARFEIIDVESPPADE